MTVIATLIIERPSGSWTERFRAPEVVVDDQSRGRVAAGQHLALALPPGRHRVRVGEVEREVHLGSGETVTLRLVTAGGVRLETSPPEDR